MTEKASVPPATRKLELQQQVDQNLGFIRKHLEVAEKTYPVVLKQYDQLHIENPQLPVAEKVAQAIQQVGGARAEQLAQSIAQDADHMRMFRAGENIAVARKALSNANLEHLAVDLLTSNPNIEDVKITRDALRHSEAINRGVPSADYPKVAQAANAEIDQFVTKLQAAPITDMQRPGVQQALGQLAEAQGNLGQFNSPEGYRLSNPADLTPALVESATLRHEIRAGNHAKLMKTAGQKLGYPYAPAMTSQGRKMMAPNVAAGEHVTDAIQLRGNEIAHNDLNPQIPTAIERANKGELLLDRLPADRLALEKELENLAQGKATRLSQAANDPVYMQAAMPQPASSSSAAVGTSPAVPAVNAEPLPPSTTPDVAKVLTEEASAAGEAGALARMGKMTAVGVVVGAGVEIYKSVKAGDDALTLTEKGAIGAVHGAVDTVVPGMRNGYDDVVGKKDLTWVDRTLNATHDASATTAVAASGATALGVETGPLDIVPAAVAGGAGVVNLGANLLKAGVKVTGLAGKDQDGGYVYDGVALAYAGLEKGASWTASKIDGLISGGQDKNAVTAAPKTPTSERVTGHAKSDR